ncbi:MAG: alkaline phosphatase family protein [Candidatus Heimdallarchaeota archaeon]|nr:alkaline phosphatase family protein [Candidatus Heimdallarchaeota archaeon]
MSKVDEIKKQCTMLSKDLDLYEPNFERSVTGLLPEIIHHMNIKISLPDNLMRNKDVEKKFRELYPNGFDRVILIIADGLGVEHLLEHGGLLAKNIEELGTVASTVFPTMTSTIMSSISFATLPPGHGIVGYNIYNEHIDDIWSALALKYKRGEEERYVFDDFEPDKLFNGVSLIEYIKEYSNPFVAPSMLEEPSLMEIMMKDYPLAKYDDIEGAITLVAKLSSQKPFTGLYYPLPDKYGHEFGPDSEQYKQSIQGLDMIISKLLELPHINNDRTAIIVTADHGQSKVDHSISHWMSRERWSEIRQKGILLSTSGRAIHAYCDADSHDEARKLLEEMAGDKGIVIDKMKAMQLSGFEITDGGFDKRIGDFMMVMKEGYLYDVPERVVFESEMKLLGQHGGLSSKELFVPVGIF